MAPYVNVVSFVYVVFARSLILSLSLFWKLKFAPNIKFDSDW